MTGFKTIFICALAGLTAACAPGEVSHTSKTGKLVAMSEKEQHMLRMAEATRAGGDPAMAADFYRRAMEASEGNVTAHLGLASMMRAQNNPTEALAALAQAEKLQPDNADIWREEGNSLIALNKPDEALQKFTKAVELAPGDARGYNGKGVALDMLGKHDEAQAAYRQGIEMYPQDSGYIESNLALSYLAAKRYDDAIALLAKLAALPEASPTVRQNLALAYGLNGELEQAEEIAKQDLSPEDVARNQRFFEFYQKHKDTDVHHAMAVPTQPVVISPLSPAASVPTQTVDSKPAASEPQLEAHTDFVTTAKFDGEDAPAAGAEANAKTATPKPEPEAAPVVTAPGKISPESIRVETPKVEKSKEEQDQPKASSGPVSVKRSTPDHVAVAPKEEAKPEKKQAAPAMPESRIIIAPEPEQKATPEEPKTAPEQKTEPEQKKMEKKEAKPVGPPRKTTPADF